MDLSPGAPELYTPASGEGPALESAASPAPISSTLETWRGTLPEAIRAARQHGVALARPDHPDQPLGEEALAAVERAQEQVCPDDPPRAYALLKDGTVYNTVLRVAEFVPVRQTPTAPVSLPAAPPSPPAASPVVPT